MKQFIFETGKTYYCRSVCDYNCVWKFEILSRTEKTVTLSSGKRCKINTMVHDGESIQYVRPLGKYSMAPVLSADKITNE